MRERSDATAPGAGQQRRQENQWIKSGSRLDLEGVSRRLRPSLRRPVPSERSPAASDSGRHIAEGRLVAALSAAPMYRADLERSWTGDRDQRISARWTREGTQCPWASLTGSVRNRRLRSDEIRSSTSNGVYRSAAIKLSATISPPERAKGIEPIASHELARPIIVSYAFLSVHWKFSKFLLDINHLNGGSFESNRVGGATRPPCRRRLREGVALQTAAIAAPAWARAARAIGRWIARASARYDFAGPGLSGDIARAIVGLRPGSAGAETGLCRG
jgi:hypothetical protein